MRILYLSDSNFPSQAANSVHVIKMCEAFGELSHQVMLTGISRSTKTPTEICSYYDVKEVFHLALNKVPPVKGALFYHAMLNAWKARKFNPDVIIGRSFLSVALAGLVTQSPVIFETHSPIRNLNWLQARAFRIILRRASFLIVISEALRNILTNEFRERGLSSPPVSVHHDGATKSNDAAAITLPGSRLTVGYIGTVHAGRGIELLVDLSKTLPDVEFHVVGGTLEDIRSRLQIQDIPENFICHGYKSPRESNALRKAFDILVAPYQKATQVRSGARTSDYMSPLKIFEYMAVAKPIIASDLPVIREVLNSDNAILVGPDDLNAWRDAVISLKTKELRVKFGHAASRDFEKKYTWKARAEEILKQLNFNPSKNEARFNR